MINIIKSDIYKTIKSTYFWVISIIMFASYMFACCIELHFTNESFIQTGICTSSIFSYLSTIPGSVYLYLCLFLIISTCLEFSSGSIKNTASKGYPREFLYLSKFICALLALVFYILICAIGFFICAQIMIGNNIPNFYSMLSDFASSFFLHILQAIACISVTLMISILVRSSGASMAIFFIAITMMPTLGILLDSIFKHFLEWNFSIQPYLLISSVSIDIEHLVRSFIVMIAYTLVPLIIGIYTFKKRDIK